MFVNNAIHSSVNDKPMLVSLQNGDSISVCASSVKEAIYRALDVLRELYKPDRYDQLVVAQVS